MRAEEEGGEETLERRGFLGDASTYAMAAGLAASYGTLGVYGARYLYPAREPPSTWLFVARTADLRPGDAIDYVLPSGARVTVTRRDGDETPASFFALSSTCPHLGCKVFWEAPQQRFFCPCHNGVFAPDGSPRSGPPADAGQSLPRFPLEVRDGLLFIQTAVGGLAAGERGESGEDALS